MLWTGTITAIDGGTAKLRLSPPAEQSCGTCGGCAGCGAAVRKPLELEAEAPPGARPGDPVEAELDLPDPAKVAILLFGLPLLLAALAGLGARAAGAEEGGTALAGAGALGLGFLLVSRIAAKTGFGRIGIRRLSLGSAHAHRP